MIEVSRLLVEQVRGCLDGGVVRTHDKFTSIRVLWAFLSAFAMYRELSLAMRTSTGRKALETRQIYSVSGQPLPSGHPNW